MTSRYFKERYEKESILDYILKDYRIIPPLYHNNKGRTLRFDLISKSEKENGILINDIFDDIFYENSPMLVVFYGYNSIRWQSEKCYFKKLTVKKLFKTYYEPNDKDMIEDKPYLVACSTLRKYFKQKRFIEDYMADDLHAQISFISLKKDATIQLYDSRGFDVLSNDKDLLRLLYNKYSKYIIEDNRAEIEKSLYNEINPNDKEIVLKAAEIAQVFMPQNIEVETQQYGDLILSYVKIADEKDKKTFVESITQNADKWTNKISTDLQKLLPSWISYDFYDRFMLYNADMKEYNQTPKANGRYNFIMIIYKIYQNKMIVIKDNLYCNSNDRTKKL